MLKRLFAHNYKCFVNFEFMPKAVQLVAGRNGVGKTSLVDVLALLKLFAIEGYPVSSIFPSRSLTYWQQLKLQRFEIEVAGNGGLYSYVVEIEHEPSAFKSRVGREELRFEKAPLFSFVGGNVQLFNDASKEGPKFTLDWTRSGLFNVTPGPSNSKLSWFKTWMSRIFRVQLNPFAMGSRAEREDSALEWHGVNFASWYRHQAQENQGLLSELFAHLRNAIDGFDSFSLVNVGENVRLLRAVFKDSNAMLAASGWTNGLGFEELSEGQKCLALLYSALVFAARGGALLCFDEPDNFVALRELQPFITELTLRSQSEHCQTIVCSHHPELINYFSAHDCVVLSRPSLGATQVKDLVVDKSLGLSPSEVLARGWEDE